MRFNFFETILEKISLRQFIMGLLVVLLTVELCVFYEANYNTMYKTIFNERIDKIKYIDNVIIQILQYRNSLVKQNKKTLKQAQKEAIETIKNIEFKEEYIWIDNEKGGSVYHPIPKFSVYAPVDQEIQEIIKKSNEGYLQYKWKKIEGPENQLYTKVSYVKLFKEWGWIIGNGVYIDDIKYKVITSMFKGTIPIILVLILIFVLLRQILLRAIVKPIDNLAKISQNLEEGNFNVSIPTSQNQTELGKLYRIFNKFVKLFMKAQKDADAEVLKRNITEKIRSSLDIDETLYFICEETAKLFNVQKTAIVQYLDPKNLKLYDIKKEYKSSEDVLGFLDDPSASDVAEYWGNILIQNGLQAFDNTNSDNLPDYFRNKYLSKGIKSIMGTQIKKGDKIWGFLTLSEYNEYRHWTDEEKNLLDAIADQIYIAINQAELYSNTKQHAEREIALRNISDTIRSSLDINKIKQSFVTEIGKTLNMDRTVFVQYDSKSKKFLPIDKYSEYLLSSDVKSMVDLNIEEYEFFNKAFIDGREIIAHDFSEFIKDNNLQETTAERYVEKYDIKSGVGIPIYYLDQVFGRIMLHHTKNTVKFSEDEINFIKTISGQAGMALYQAKLYENINAQAERENLLRKITEAIRSSLDIDKTLHLICEEITKLFNVQRTAIGAFHEIKSYDDFNLTKEYKISPEFKVFSDMQANSNVLPIWEDALIKNKEIIAINNIMESEYPNSFKEAYIGIGVKSLLGIAIKNNDDVWGTLVLSDYINYRNWSQEDKELLKDITVQIYIALHQAELYENEKVLVEREKISRNIIEILRSSIDKTIIKTLFVKNIGKFFDADRVLLSEYDSEQKMYLPADKNSECLFNPNEHSLAGFDWSKPEVREFIQPLLEKRELNIYSWDEYIQQNKKGQDFINFFEGYNIKSSYNFPIVYQQNIMGFFCIDFVNEPKVLSEEEISRLRNMSSQAGIALYHAELYTKAQECFNLKEALTSEVYRKVREPVQGILDTSIQLTQQDFERENAIIYLNKIINSCNQLLELTDKYQVD